MVKNSAEELQTLQIFYEISMSIGTSLDLSEMLEVCLSTFLEKLNCAASGIHLLNRQADAWKLEKAYSIPRDTEQNDLYQVALAQAPISPNQGQWARFCKSLPLSGQSKIGHYYYIFELPDFGLMILVKYDEPLSPALVKSLKPLLLKLSTACRACLNEAALQASLQRYDRIETERKSPLRDATGKVVGIMGTSLDITERKQAEETLAKRAVELETIAQVAIATSTILDVDELLQEVVDLIKERLNLYHAHIYLLNQNGDTLNLVAGAGEIGRQMVAEGWRIALDQQQSLVARAVRLHQGVIINDVRQDPDYFQNPLLPNTRSEMAVPMMSGGQLFGVLDVQADMTHRFSEEDVHLQTTLATQVAIALRNAQQYEQIQRRTRREQLVNTITQKIQGTVTVESAMQMAIRELGQALQARYTQVKLTASVGKTNADMLTDGVNGETIFLSDMEDGR